MSHECPGAVGQGNIWDTRFGALPLPCPPPHQATLKDSSLVGTVSKFSFHKAHTCPEPQAPTARCPTLYPASSSGCTLPWADSQKHLAHCPRESSALGGGGIPMFQMKTWLISPNTLEVRVELLRRYVLQGGDPRDRQPAELPVVPSVGFRSVTEALVPGLAQQALSVSRWLRPHPHLLPFLPFTPQSLAGTL